MYIHLFGRKIPLPPHEFETTIINASFNGFSERHHRHSHHVITFEGSMRWIRMDVLRYPPFTARISLFRPRSLRVPSPPRLRPRRWKKHRSHLEWNSAEIGKGLRRRRRGRRFAIVHSIEAPIVSATFNGLSEHRRDRHVTWATSRPFRSIFLVANNYFWSRPRSLGASPSNAEIGKRFRRRARGRRTLIGGYSQLRSAIRERKMMESGTGPMEAPAHRSG